MLFRIPRSVSDRGIFCGRGTSYEGILMQLDYGFMKPVPRKPGDNYSHADWVFEENQALLAAAELAEIKDIDRKNFSEIREELKKVDLGLHKTWCQFKEILM